ncbi:autotransporter domain-containing protein [Cetobacterium somerae]|uniref:autotransporter outer membrane beta-barrel domain-containing protein n=1 Tax=Cetobacterium somerae TaxID=188913 RepID=UPI00211E60BA|nr:autotransporter outer membrane beta-barrel domain-containing protein [Cetobacterium somerae]MCQ9626143.1 autotransporter domain-containing protein [Cetobacterium somerae]
MKIYNKKYLFIGILASLVTACGSGGGGGGSNSNSPSVSTPSPTVLVKPAENVGKVENNSNRVDDKNDPSLPSVEEVIPSQPIEPKEEVAPAPQPDAPQPEDPQPDEELPPPPPFEKPPLKNSATLDIKEEGRAALVSFNGETAINEKAGVINVSAKHASAIVALGKNSKGVNDGTINGVQSDLVETMNLMEGSNGGNLENNGTIKGTGISVVAMANRSSHGEGFTSTNNGEIELNGNNQSDLYHTFLIGMEATKIIDKDGVDEDITLINNKNITVNNDNFHLLNPNAVSSMYIRGMSMNVYDKSNAKNTMINNGNITVSGKHSSGMSANGNNITMINKGVINASSEDSNGMVGYGENIKAINEGTINVSGRYSNGISVSHGAIGINEKSGIIKIDGKNAFAMSAVNGSKVINKGKIILNGDSIGMYAGGAGVNSDKYAPSSIINEGEIVLQDFNLYKIAIWATGNATYVNKGKIIGDDGIEIKTEDKGQFIVGKEASGDIARVRAKRSLKIDGDVVASKDLIEDNKKEIIYKDVFSAPKIELARSTDSKAVSMFYDSKLELNSDKNVDMVVYRNETTVEESYESTEFKSLTNSLDNYLDVEGMKLSKDEKLVVDKILKSDNVNEIKKVVKDLSGEIYANLPRQIFDIQDRFIKEDSKLIDNLNEYSYNFNFFGDKSSVKDKGEISGYKTTSEGFVGTKRFENNIFATIGYENSSVKYNEGSKGTIQSIHTGVYKKLLLNEFDIKLGLNGEYNFHETNREIDSFDKKAKGKYNSYTLGANGEISRVYGDSLYIKPTLGLNLGYGKYEKFSEKNAGDLGLTIKEESYFSILPSVGFKVGKNFESVDIYSNAIYSYELGDLNKKQDMSLLGDKINYKLNSDSLEKANLVLNAGVSTEIKDFKITFEVGKEFGKRDNNYLALGIGYKF